MQCAIHHEAAAASRANFLQGPYRGLERGADRKDQPRTDLVNALVCGNGADKGEAEHSAAKMLDLDKIGNNYVRDNYRFDDSEVLKHRSNPSPHDPQTSCAGKRVSAIRRIRSLVHCSQRKPSQPSQRKPRARQAGEALRGGKA